MEVKKFVQQETGQSLWEKEFETPAGDTGTMRSMGVEVIDRIRDLNTGISRNERRIVWCKTTDSVEDLESDVKFVIDAIKAKRLGIVRQYSHEPLWDNHQEDINPNDGTPLGRYSITKLAPYNKVMELDKTYLSEEEVARYTKRDVAPPVDEPAAAGEIEINT